MNSQIKVGIVTLYYNNYNFGGLLQSYALPYVLENVYHLNAEQITYMLHEDDVLYFADSKLKKHLILILCFLSCRLVILANCFFLRRLDIKKQWYHSCYTFDINRLRKTSDKLFKCSINRKNTKENEYKIYI